jgi:glyoxylate/hydroxypyruvate reductase
MSEPVVVFYSDYDDPDPWRRLFARHQPQVGFRVWPDVGDASDITHALVFNIPRGAWKRLPNVRVVFALGAGVDQIIDDPDFPRTVPLYRLIDAGMREQMTGYALYGVLHWHRRMGEYAAQAMRREWLRLEAVHPTERSVGVMGLGVFGSDLAQKLVTLGFKVCGWSRTRKAMHGVDCFAGNDELAAFLARAEILVNVLPLTGETRGILNSELYAKLPGNGALIHLGRGGHLIERDLIAALEAKRLDWAMIDVFPTEPLPRESALWAHPKILVTPHIAATGSGRTEQQILEAFQTFERGEEPPGRVDLSAGY